MQLITMNVEETLEQKTLPNGLVDNANAGETANGQSKITDKDEANNASIEKPKALEPVQPDGENCKPMENLKESVVNEDATEVNSKDTNTAILNEKQNGGSAAKNKDMESLLSEQDIKINNEDTCNNSVEDQKEINTHPTQATTETVAEVSEVFSRDVQLEPIACEDNNEDLLSASTNANESVASNIPKDDAVKAQINSSEVTNVTNDTTGSNSVKIATTDIASKDEVVVTETSVITEVTPKTDELLFEQNEDIVEQMDTCHSSTDIIDAGSTESSKENDAETKPTKDFKEECSLEDLNAKETATLTVDEIALEVNNDVNIENEDAMDTATTISEKAKKSDITKENSKNADTNKEETVDIVDFKEECSLEDLNAKETATLNVDEIALEVNNDVDIEKEDTMDTATTISEEPKKSDITKEISKYTDTNKEETVDIATSLEVNNDVNIENLAMDTATTISEEPKKSDVTNENSKNTDTNKEETVDIATSINNEGETVKKLSDSNDGDAMETDNTVCNKIETQDTIVPDIENAMDTATTNNDEIRKTEATEEGDKKDISLVDEAMVIKSTIEDKTSEDEITEKSEISIECKDDINMDIKTVENDSIDFENTKNESVKNIENNEDNEEALLASPSHKTNLIDEDDIERTKDMSLENVNLDSADCGQVENPAIDITEDSPENDPPAIVIDGDKTDTISETKSKGNDSIENKDDKKVQAVPQKAKTRSSCGLSNTLDILSDDDDDDAADIKDKVQPPTESHNKCIDIDDDDDVMLIEEDYSSKDSKSDEPTVTEQNDKSEDDKVKQGDDSISTEENKDKDSSQLKPELPDKTDEVIDIPEDMEIENIHISEKPIETEIPKVQDKRPIVPPNFLKTFKTNVEKMTREELEEFCLLKIVEAVVDRTNLGDIKARLKTMHQQMEAWKKKAAGLSKQNRDLQIVLKTVQEEQKKKTDGPITPLRITRSVGMQVYMAENLAFQNKKKSHHPRVAKFQAPPPTPKQTKPSSPQIPVPRLVPAINSSPAKNIRQSPVQNSTVSSNSVKAVSPMANGLKNPPATKPVEKRPFSSVQAVTVDLTDDEPPPKVAATAKNPPATVRMVPQNQLMARPQFNQNANSPRKVFIPINTPNQPVIRPGQTLMLKSVPPPGPRHRAPAPMVRIPQNSGPPRAPRLANAPRHPAPLPDVPKQQQPPNWKSLPPAPDLKISKVENGIVISWKIDGFTVVNFEEIASYQLYAYQETSAPPNTMLWKKIGDVKALPLPMACTLTQFMAGYKYYFAVRAVDVRSRIGPFSLPGSILLLNK